MFYNYILNIARKAAGLAIKAGGSAVAKIANVITITIDGDLIPVTAKDIDLTNVTSIGSNGQLVTSAFILTDQFQTVLTVYADTAGAITLGKGLEVSKHVHYNSVQIDKSQNATKAIIGYIYLKNETAATFTGGTTAIDASGMTALFTDTYSPLGI